MPIEMVKGILHQVGNALGYAHRHGIVHRDVKPANIMIDEEGWSVVTDFGIAKVAENRGLTMTGIAVGTPSYMSPEQCAAKDITGKSDQYSLGIVAYEMIAGKQPFEADSAMAIMFAHFHEQPKPIHEVRPDCPPDLSAAVMRMLEKAPDNRWPSMEAAVSALGAHQLSHDDPMRLQLVEIVKKGSTREILAQVTPPPTSPVPPAKTRQVPEAAPTTPMPLPKVLSIGIAPARSDLHVGDSMQLTATPRSTGGTGAAGKVSWSSSNSSIATVSASGLVTAVAPGSATISATCDGVNGSAQVSVTVVPVASVLVEPAGPSLAIGEQLQFKASLKDQHGATLTEREIKWSASPSGLISLSGSGLAVANKEGAVEVVAESEGVKGTTRLTVTPAPVAKIAITPAEASVTVGGAITLEAALSDKNGGKLTGREVTWRSSTEKVATVSNRGAVIGQTEGASEITATAEGKQATARVRVTAAPVASVSILDPKPVAAGDTVQLEVQLKDAKGQLLTGRPVKWSSSSPGVATVTGDGHLTGMAQGSAKITAESEGKSWTITVMVQPVPVASVTIEGGADPLTIGGSVTLKTVVKDAKGNLLSGREVVWTSSAARVAAVNSQGVISAKSAGDTTISATVDSKKAERKLSVLAPAKPVEPPAPPPPLAEVKTEVLKSADSRTEIIAPLPKPEPRRETQAVAAPPKGKGMLIGAGVAVALLAAVGWFLLRPKPEVVPPGPEPPTPVHAPVATVAIAGESGPVAVGRTRQLGVVIRDAGGAELSARSVDWSSSDPAVAEVSKNGAVTGNKAGSATITATSEGKSATLVLTVEAGGADLPAAVASVAIAGAGKAIEVGETVQLNAVAKDTKGAPLGDRTVVWSTGEPGVALVSSGGLVTAVGPGTVTISASSEGKSADAKVIVNAPKPVPKPPEPAPEPTPVALASVTVSPPAATVVAGQTIQLSVVAKDAKGKVVNDRVLAWSSDDQHIATVTNSGLVQGVVEGSATITVSAEGKSGRVKLTVTPAAKPIVPVAGVGIVAIGKSLKVGETVTWSAVARDSKGNSLNDRAISWTSSAPQVATVSAGVITAVGPGTTEIRAESEGKSVVERITVAALPAPPPQPVPQPGPPTNPPVPATGASALAPRKAVEAGGLLSCGITQGGTAVCWGAGRGLTAIAGTSGITGLTVGRAHACGLLAGGRAVCWGGGAAGQLGDGGSAVTQSAVAVAGDLSFSMITAGVAHTCGLSGGKAYCWGGGKSGQLGDGSSNDRKKPVAVKGGFSFVAISAGGNHTCALTEAGKAYCWGDGFSGQLGFGGQEQQAEPIDVSGGQKFSRIAAGRMHTCALNTAGRAFCWGANESGQVGDGSKSDRASPQAVAGGPAFTEISAGGNHTCAISGGGEAFCWGEGQSGQLGDGGKGDRTKPFAVTGGLSFSSISAGEGYTCGLAHGQAQCWGKNDKGQLGDGGTTPKAAPAPVGE